MMSEPTDARARWERDAPLLKIAGKLARFGGWSIDVSSGEIYWSSEMFDLLGFDEALGAPPRELSMQLYPAEDRARIETALDRCIQNGTPFDFEGAILDSHGARLQVRALGEAVRDADGRVTTVHGAFYEVSEIVREREERIAAQDALERALDYIPDVVCFVDERWRFTFANSAAAAIAARDAAQWRSLTIWETFPELELTPLRAAYERTMVDRVSTTTRAHLPQADAWVEAIAHPVEGGIALFVRDVTDDELRNRELNDLTERGLALSSLLDISHEAFITEDLDNVVTYWNRGAEDIYGWTRDEAVGRNIRDLIYTDTAAFEAAAAELLATGRWTGELHQRAKDGRQLIVACRWQAIIDDDGKPRSLFAVNSDVTKRRELDALQARTQRLESLGTLAGGIAHDLNNILTPVLMSLQLMRMDPLADRRDELLAGMESSVLRGAEMIKQVLSFARGVDGVSESVRVPDLIDELSALTLAVLPKSISVEKHLDDVPPFIGDATQVLQVLVNLVTNARDAMPEGGVLRLSAAEVQIGAGRSETLTLAPGRYVSISVADSGSGMSDEVRSRIFEPFYTTKGIGEGTGLGLASSEAIVRSHGGYLDVQTEVGVGSQFTLFLPVAHHGAAEVADGGPDEGHLPHGMGELVLVVDDEPSIRAAICQTLEVHGYRTVTASHGREAIEVHSEHADHVQLVLTDMMMPVMDGAATAAFFAEHYPQVAVVAMSGLNAAAAVERARDSGVQYFVAKPFTTDTVVRTVRDALASSHRA